MIHVCSASTREDFQGIRQLQEANLRRNLSESEVMSEGFVTAEYTTDFLAKMSTFYPAAIAKTDNGLIVGYALIVSKKLQGDHALLDDMIEVIDKISLSHDKDNNINSSITHFKSVPYVLCGQLCVALGYRGKGLVTDLYNHLRHVVQTISPEVHYCFTEVAHDNKRSLRAHEKCGFKVIQSHTFGATGFDIILLDWIN